MHRYDVIIVGGGHGGAQAAIALRQLKFQGSVCLVGAEPEFPYERPPLSKEFLAGEKSFERLLIRQPVFWQERNITMVLGRRVVAVLPDKRRVDLDDGSTLEYGRLIWAAGATARPLSCDGAHLQRVHTVRCRADVEAIMRELPAARDVVVIGGGYIGLEAAAVLTQLGKRVAVLEALDRVLARVTSEPVSRFFEAEHKARGVNVKTSTKVECILGSNAVATGVRLSNGETIAADMVLVGVGIVSSTEPLARAGAMGRDGVDVSENCRTSLEDVFAIGDCAAHENRYAANQRLRLESVQNATDQAMTAVKAVLGQPEPYANVPWFWSHQYDLRMQTVGLSTGYDDCVVRGDPATKSFSVAYLRDRQLVALDCLNAPKDYVQARKLIQEGATPDKHELADASIQIKEVRRLS